MLPGKMVNSEKNDSAFKGLLKDFYMNSKIPHIFFGQDNVCRIS